jgi:hypothetical protein
MAKQMFSKCLGIYIVDVLGKSVRYLLILSVQLYEVKSINQVLVVLSIFLSYHWVVAVEPY